MVGGEERTACCACNKNRGAAASGGPQPLRCGGTIKCMCIGAMGGGGKAAVLLTSDTETGALEKQGRGGVGESEQQAVAKQGSQGTVSRERGAVTGSGPITPGGAASHCCCQAASRPAGCRPACRCHPGAAAAAAGTRQPGCRAPACSCAWPGCWSAAQWRRRPGHAGCGPPRRSRAHPPAQRVVGQGGIMVRVDGWW